MHTPGEKNKAENHLTGAGLLRASCDFKTGHKQKTKQVLILSLNV